MVSGLTKIFAGSKKCAKAGNRISAPSMFTTNINARRMPISAWNLIGENAQVATAIARVMPVSITTFPVKSSAW
ncbi:hypothetical protein D9M71_799620 [compost metagenome]